MYSRVNASPQSQFAHRYWFVRARQQEDTSPNKLLNIFLLWLASANRLPWPDLLDQTGSLMCTERVCQKGDRQQKQNPLKLDSLWRNFGRSERSSFSTIV
jgi:hypothetical protein